VTERARKQWARVRPVLVSAVLLLTVLLLTGCYREVIPDATPTTGATAQAAETETPTLPPAGTDDTPAPTPTHTPTPTPTATPTATPAEGTPSESPLATPTPQAQVIHIVQAGENMYRIALHYGTTITAIADANGIANPTQISVGQQLVIPVTGVPTPTPAATETTYVVQVGDNLYRIGLRFGVSHLVIAAYNGLSDPSDIHVGQVLRIPLP